MGGIYVAGIDNYAELGVNVEFFKTGDSRRGLNAIRKNPIKREKEGKDTAYFSLYNAARVFFVIEIHLKISLSSLRSFGDAL